MTDDDKSHKEKNLPYRNYKYSSMILRNQKSPGTPETTLELNNNEK